MTEKIKLDIISDVVCPWCIIGYGNIQKAIKELNIESDIEIEWHPFELNPDMSPQGENLSAHSARKYGSTPESSQQFRHEMTQRGQDIGFKFNYFPDMKMVNTRKAHILLDYAKNQGKQTALKLRLFNAFFSEKKDISDIDTLKLEAEAVGLISSDISALLNAKSNHSDIEQQEHNWHKLGVNSVPTVIINQKLAVSGAQPVEIFKQIISGEI